MKSNKITKSVPKKGFVQGVVFTHCIYAYTSLNEESDPIRCSIDNGVCMDWRKCDGRVPPSPLPTLEIIGGCRTLTQAEAGEPVPPVTAPQALEPKKDKHFYANGLYSCLGLVTQKEMAQIKKERPLWKTNADVFYYGVQALLEKNPQRMVS